MLHMTVQAFALEIQISVEDLIRQFLDVGIVKSKLDFVTNTEKEILLTHMSSNQIAIFSRFSLRRKTRSTLNVLSTGGKNKKVQIEVRKKRVYVQCTAQQHDISVVKSELKNNLHTQMIKNTNENSTLRSMTEVNKFESGAVLNKNLEEGSVCNSNIIDISNVLETKISAKDCKKSKKKLDKNYPLLNPTSTKDNNNNKNPSMYNEKKEYSSNKLNRFSESKVSNYSDNQKSENGRRRYLRMRSRSRFGNKLIKQQRKGNNQIFYEDVVNSLHCEEKSSLINKINKSRCKSSILVHSFNKPNQLIARDIIIGKEISVLSLSNKMSVKSSYMIKMMMSLGLTVTVDQILDQETAQLVIEEMGHRAILRCENKLEELIMHDHLHDVAINKNNHVLYKNRAPIVAIMGHVDHGKTSLLDYIRSTRMVDTELGGITQRIGAYSIKIKDNTITFIDTPGHAAFFKMRARGVQLTDIVILVIAADDGVMPQTIEAMQHIKSANLPVIVAVNKIDKIEIDNFEYIKSELNRYGLIPEEWGGNTQFVNISATLGIGIDNLLDSILLHSEMLDLKTIFSGKAKAIVIESSIDKTRGPIVTILVREGILHSGDIILCGTEYGRVRAMRNEFGKTILSAGPSIPVELLGLSGAPNAGEMMIVVNDEKKARDVAISRKEKRREMNLSRTGVRVSTIEDIFVNMNNINKIIVLNFIIKADTQGSMEAIYESIKCFSTQQIIVKVVSLSIGDITETDVVLASTSNAIILAFNVKSNIAARRIITSDYIEVHYFSVIYDLLDTVKKMVFDKSLSTKHVSSNIIGIAEINSVFCSSKFGNIAGCIVREGVVKINKTIKIIRNKSVLCEGFVIESLRHFRNDVDEVKSGTECGIKIKNYSSFQSGDIIQIIDDVTEKVL